MWPFFPGVAFGRTTHQAAAAHGGGVPSQFQGRPKSQIIVRQKSMENIGVSMSEWCWLLAVGVVKSEKAPKFCCFLSLSLFFYLLLFLLLLFIYWLKSNWGS